MATVAPVRVKMCGTVSGNGTRMQALGASYSLEFEGGRASARFSDGDKIRVIGFLDRETRRVLVEFAKAVPGMDLELHANAAKIKTRVLGQTLQQGRGALQTV